MEQFIHEGMDIYRLSFKRACEYRIELVGSSLPFFHVGYIRFLKSFGQIDPQITEMNSFFIGRYWEFLIQHYGAIQAANAVKVLRCFWLWCKENEYLSDPLPPDLKGAGVDRPYLVLLKIKESDK